jgi:hypothetical protein
MPTPIPFPVTHRGGVVRHPACDERCIASPSCPDGVCARASAATYIAERMEADSSARTVPKHPHISRIRDVPPVTDWSEIEEDSAPRRGITTRRVLAVLGVTGVGVLAALLIVHWGAQ